MFGGGLKSLRMFNHDRRFCWRCSECYSMNVFQRVPQPCNERMLCVHTACFQQCKGIMIIISEDDDDDDNNDDNDDDEQPASRMGMINRPLPRIAEYEESPVAGEQESQSSAR